MGGYKQYWDVWRDFFLNFNSISQFVIQFSTNHISFKNFWKSSLISLKLIYMQRNDEIKSFVSKVEKKSNSKEFKTFSNKAVILKLNWCCWIFWSYKLFKHKSLFFPILSFDVTSWMKENECFELCKRNC